MKSSIAILLLTAMVVVIPFAKAHKVADLISQFKGIFRWYLKYRRIEFKPEFATDKADAMGQALILLGAMQLHRDIETNFVFGFIDIETFGDKEALDSQVHTIFKAGYTDAEKFKYPMPTRVFKNITAANLTFKDNMKLSNVEKILKTNYAGENRKGTRDVALEYELIETADLDQQNDASPTKQYMLFMLAKGTQA